MRHIWTSFFVLLFVTKTFALPLPFYDNFSDSAYDGWSVYDVTPYEAGPSNWYVESGCLRQNSNIYTTTDEYSVFTGTQITTGDTTWTNYSFNIELKSTDDDGIGIIFRVRNNSNYYRYLSVADPANRGPFRRLEKCVAGTFTTLAEDHSYFAYDPLFSCFTAIAIGDTIEIYMDGTRILNAIDGTFRHGKIGMTCYANDGAYFDNISVLSGRHIGTNGSMWVKPFLQKPSQSSMTVCWETTVPTTGKVLWGTSPCIFTDSISVSSARIHEATIIGLTTATRYYYGVRYGDSLLCGADYTFKTNPLPSARVRICIWGDNRTDPVAHNRICEAMLTKNPDMVINVGDVVSNGSVYDQYRTEFFNPASNLIRCTPFYVAIGNHEGENAWYYNYFSLPGDERYFAVDYGAAHFVFMNSNISYIPVISEQYTWVSDELASTASQSAPWLFVMLHHPPYSEGWDSPGYDGEPNVRDYLVPVWELNDVDFVFAGHTHDYERGAKAGVNYIITGGGGSALDHWLQDWEWISIYQAVYHYVLLDITSSYVIYRAYDWNNALIESTLFGTYLDVEQSVDTRPGKFQIESVSPNPFNASARISFSTDVVEHIEVLITDISGRQIAKICDGILPAGKHEAIWEVERYSYRGKKVPSGTYFAVIRAGDRKLSQKIELIR